MPACQDPSCGVEVRDGEAAGEKLFVDETSGRVISLIRHEVCADRYASAGSRFRRISSSEKKNLLSPASAMKNELAARRREKLRMVKA